MSEKVDLRLDWCSYEAAKYAVEHWHYSQRMPKSKLAKIGVWESNTFIGAVIFGVGATSDLVKQFGLTMVQGCELVRVALDRHKNSVSRILMIAIKMIRKEFPGLRLIVSFADPEHNHNGAIYQAGNWFYTGRTAASDEYLINGKRWHGRAFCASKPAHLTTEQAARLIDPDYQKIKGSSKHRYLYPLDDAMRKQIEPLRKPYPKRETCGLGETDSAPRTNEETGGASPTSPLLDVVIERERT
jgi:hypothetical protein